MKQLLVSFTLLLQFWCASAMSEDLRMSEDLECQIDTPSIAERIENRSFPSIFQPWLNIYNLPGTIDADERITYHDLMWHAGFGNQYFSLSNELIDPENNFYWEKLKTSLMLSLNPNLIFIADLPVKALGPNSWVHKEHLKRADFPWLRDAHGNRRKLKLEGHWIDFTRPEAQEMFAEQAKAYQDCGYDGIFLDFWQEDEDTQCRQAQVEVLKRIRELVGDAFLIIVNTNDEINASSAPYINGLMMETYRDLSDNYSHRGMVKLEQTLLWAAANLQEPVVNSLEGQGIGAESPMSPANLQGMRLFTTLSLTHSDGYMLYTMGVGWNKPHEHDENFRGPRQWWQRHLLNHEEPHDHHHAHYWHDFWDADLGQPIGEIGQLYDDAIEGLFIREFTNGWAVYNRSGKTQTIEFLEEVSGVASGVKDNRRHTVPDLDGEIYLKTVVQVTPGEYPPLYWIDAKTDTLQRLVDTEIKNLFSGVQNATSLTIDTVDKKLYWTEKTGTRTGKIQSATLEGNPNVQLVRNLTSAPLDIAIDTTAGKLYLSNAWGKIQRMNLDGSNFQPNLIIGLKAPQNLVLDTTSSQLYWTEQTGKTTGNIKRANLDGSNVRLVKKLTSVPRGMFLDAVNRKLYLTNAWGKLQRMSLDGSGFQPNFITGLESPGQVVVDRVGGKVYWRERGKLRRADFEGENIQDVVTGLGELADIALGIQSVSMDVAAAPALTAVVEQTQLLANYPNPFNPETWIPYQLANDTDVEIHIYDTRGGLVRSLELGHQCAGIYTGTGRAAYWDGRNSAGEPVASGIYFYQLQAEGLSYVRKMVIMK